MKIRKLTILSALAIGLISCGGNETKHEAAAEAKTETHAPEAAEKAYTVNIEQSKIDWKGEMLGAYSHNGDLKLKSGSITVKGQDVLKGSFEVDLTTINPTDENYSEEHPKANLIGHLGSDDFFSTEKFPTASFVVKSSEAGTVKGDLTIKGVTKEASITDVKIEETESGLAASGTLVFNRQDFGVSYASTMKDMVLSDDISLSISLTGSGM